ncbi:MAG: glycosyltransferase [Geopsychrobacter sp.]|nr:glycosyltransferase [Geopsychrobacter sp.]
MLLKLLSVPIQQFDWMQLDRRLKNCSRLPVGVIIHFVKRSFRGRLAAEWRLYRQCRRDDVVLCFHGLPPLLPLKGRSVVFIQNRLLIEHTSLAGYPFFVRVRLIVERLWSRWFQQRCSRYIVQTPSMAASLQRWLKRDVPISVAPFAPAPLPVSDMTTQKGEFDFVYVASGEAHKNHEKLLEAWRLLNNVGHKPSLALTLDENSNPDLAEFIKKFSAAHELDIVNLGVMSRAEVFALYRTAGAMIYPSTSESFGLPLVEASQTGLPVLASELDFVRDVIEPTETFDPESPVSIARAVKRFLNAVEPPVEIGTAEGFFMEVLR